MASDDPDIDPESGEGGAESSAPASLDGLTALAAAACLSCGGSTRGPFCPWCGQKNDDLRRSSLILAKDFLRDAFGFDSRMWRTLGLLAAKPGVVPRDYARGRRSRYTPPVRLFIVVSFLFFLTIGLTDTFIIGTDVVFQNRQPAAEADGAAAAPPDDGEAAPLPCGFQAKLRFFAKETNLYTDKERLDACIADMRARARANTIEANEAADKEVAEEEVEQAAAVVDRVFTGIGWAVAEPRAFNDAFNDWLPRVLFFMTPVLAIILALFLRRDALIFDHLILSFYTHAAGFAVIALALLGAQLGASYMGLAASAAIGVYYVAALKRAYGRGWLKTLWTAAASGALYLGVLLTIVMAIVSHVIWRATA
ncbi:DUF3667 domain-containing protein [Amphiplicatus metriothermophilus]|uniref:DUF3667 domain-containing protein n=1 Tax=Amphiplicatus metriothermophilus TaxID=1519374 RepID=A0A239PK76_9PROT|nr:DUF3667 domain-containing protein [Amphiplicatus metriothermophilus]MBB5517938.1 hypothetical protein [Amphiplicatus metriothermophilus]SNT67729.1 Protein of unknown function [Amphiplicatus metriothermophilus]